MFETEVLRFTVRLFACEVFFIHHELEKIRHQAELEKTFEHLT